MNMSMEFKMFQNKILVHMKTIDFTIDHIFVHFIGSKAGLYVSFRILTSLCHQAVLCFVERGAVFDQILFGSGVFCLNLLR